MASNLALEESKHGTTHNEIVSILDPQESDISILKAIKQELTLNSEKHEELKEIKQLKNLQKFITPA